MKQECKHLLTGDLRDYKSIPFWSWNNALDERELEKQIEEMYAAGIGGFIMHARTGLTDEYLGEKWFSCIEACLKKARELHMEAWVYDENGWPSGFVGGKLLEVERFRARFLEYSVGEWEESAFACYAVDQALGYRRVTAPVAGVTEYHRVYLRVSPANTDILNPEVVDAFIQETHEEYYRRFQDSFGRELVGFFTDEPQYYRKNTPYTPAMETLFAADGEDVRDGLIWLFVHDERGYAFREKYYGRMNELYVKNFYKKIYDWCDAHDCKLTGHSIEESSLYGQMWCCAAVSPSYEYEHIPGIDSLGRRCAPELSSKQVASVAAQLGKKYVLTETYGCAGYDVTLKELKSFGESQYFRGVNKMCQHLYPYSIAGQGKVDHPPVFGPHGNFGEGFKAFNDYFTRLGALIANTKEQTDIAVLHPIREIWLEYVREENVESIREQEEAFQALLTELRKHGVTYHLLDERILAGHGSVEGDVLRVGECTYGTVLLPKMRTIASETYALLRSFKGKLCMEEAPTMLDGVAAEISLTANTTLEEIERNTAVAFACADGNSYITHRKGEIGEFLFVQNASTAEQSTVRMPWLSADFVALDLSTFEEKGVEDTFTLAPGESVILTRGKGRAPVGLQRREITEDFRVAGITDNYLILDYAEIAKEGGAFAERYPIPGLMEGLLREDYKGELTVRHTFTLREKMPLTLVMERAKLKWAKVNGRELAFGKSDLDVKFVEAEIGALCREGENEFVYAFDFWQHEGVHYALFDPMATESLRNCLYYDTSIEPVYLRGDFLVDEDMALRKRILLPPVCTDLYKRGYPFFKGLLTLRGKLIWSGEGKLALGIEGRYHVAEITVGGKRIDLALETEREITPLLRKGENDVQIVLRSSLRNMFGPHHFNPDPLGVSPYHFTLRGLWKAGYPKEYGDGYNSVPFGAEKIYIIESK